jgi:hypothetical protein
LRADSAVAVLVVLPVPVEAGDRRDFGSDFYFGARAHGAFGGDSLPHLFPKTGDTALSIFQSKKPSRPDHAWTSPLQTLHLKLPDCFSECCSFVAT